MRFPGSELLNLIGITLGLYWDDGNENGNYYLGRPEALLSPNNLFNAKIFL